jgi:hypothetical protein
MPELIPRDLDRVRRNTSGSANAKIDRQIEHNIHIYADKSRAELSQRLYELDKEWDIERIVETNASTLAFIGTLLGAFINPWFLLLPALVTAFLFQHAIQGWCPPIPILRAMGKRTRKEIDTEKFAMKVLRDDFADLNKPGAERIERVIQAVTDYQ